MNSFILLTSELPDPAVPESSIDAIISAASTVTSMVGKVFDVITGNGLLAVYAAVGLICVGITVFARLKRVAK